jgi:branched-chain amino acid transport system ATP-binding protein
MSTLLHIDQISLSFTGVKALTKVSLQVDHGELLAIIGPNGAGKTSLFNCISGVYQPQEGQIHIEDHNIIGQRPDKITELGVARMFQNLALFEHLTVLENMLLGAHLQFESRWWHDVLWHKKTRHEEVKHREHVEYLIEFLNLESVRKIPVGILPYGILKRVELGRALCMKPKLLLLDEPAAGLNHEETEDLARYLLDIKEQMGITQILIEHELRFVLELADRIAVLDFGRKIADGPPNEIRNNPVVTSAYVGAMS